MSVPPVPILVAVAWPYASGSRHLGHLAGAYLPADVFARFQRLAGNRVLMVSGSDVHGTPITVRADAEGVTPAEIADRYHAEFLTAWERLAISWDCYTSTGTGNHEAVTQDMFLTLLEKGHIDRRTGEQFFDAEAGRFLPDRYIGGTCPHCGYAEARGDQCEDCGRTLDPEEIVDPRSKITGAVPELRSTEHFFLRLSDFQEPLGAWLESRRGWRRHVLNFSKGWIEEGLQDRAITRDLDWGVAVPVDGFGDGKRIYVWFEAVIGYLSAAKEWAQRQGDPEAWRDWWEGDDARSVYFIGKDNIPFHCLVFPSMLYGTKQGFSLPWAVPANEFYNLKDGKFSTSDGRTIDPASLLENVEAEAVRWYIITTLPETADAEFSLEGLATTNNADLAGNIGNLATRVLKFIGKNFAGQVPALSEQHRAEMDAEILQNCGEIADPAEPIQAFRFRDAAKHVTANASVANLFMQRLEPWALRKTDPERAASALNTLCQYIAWLAKWMAPFLPTKAQALWEMLGCAGRVADQPWPGVPQAADWRVLPDGQALGTAEALFPRMDVP